MNVGIVGLGLIGASAAKAYKEAGHTVFGADLDPLIASFAVLDGAVHDVLDESRLSECQLLLLCIYPEGVLEWLEKHAAHVAADTLVMDFAGVKGVITESAFKIAQERGFLFVGGHPMAGSHRSGYAASRANLFRSASFVAVPARFDDPDLFSRVKSALAPLGFGRYTFCHAEEHDRMIAYTSQLAHVLSSAYARSEASAKHRGFSAGSWKDLTRVAHLNEEMWATLFLDNREALLAELDELLLHLGEYRAAIDASDRAALVSVLRDGRLKKSAADRP